MGCGHLLIIGLGGLRTSLILDRAIHHGNGIAFLAVVISPLRTVASGNVIPVSQGKGESRDE